MAEQHDDSKREHPSFLRIEHGASGSGHAASVFCPRKQHAVAIEKCRTCAFCAGLYVDPSERTTLLRCTWQTPELDDSDASMIEVAATQPSGPSTRDTKLHAIMTQPVRSVRAELGVAELVAMFFHYGIGAVPVVDRDGKAIGIVSKTDVLRRLGTVDPEDVIDPGSAAARFSHVTVHDVMSHLAYSLGAEASVSRAAALMAYEGVHRVLVTAADGTPIGIVSSLDVLRWLARNDGYVIPDLTRLQSAHKPG